MKIRVIPGIPIVKASTNDRGITWTAFHLCEDRQGRTDFWAATLVKLPIQVRPFEERN